jgi:hypothetical protein
LFSLVAAVAVLVVTLALTVAVAERAACSTPPALALRVVSLAQLRLAAAVVLAVVRAVVAAVPHPSMDFQPLAVVVVAFGVLLPTQLLAAQVAAAKLWGTLAVQRVLLDKVIVGVQDVLAAGKVRQTVAAVVAVRVAQGELLVCRVSSAALVAPGEMTLLLTRFAVAAALVLVLAVLDRLLVVAAELTQQPQTLAVAVVAAPQVVAALSSFVIRVARNERLEAR